MKKCMLCIAAALLVLSASPSFAWSCACYGGAQESTQLANKAQLIEQVKNAVEQTKAMMKNLEQLSNIDKMWGDATKQFEKLTNLANSGFSQIFGDGFSMDKFLGEYKCESGQHKNVEDLFKKIQQELLDKAKERIEAGNDLWKSVTNDQPKAIQAYRDAGAKTDGHLQALQLSNELATFLAEQLSQMQGAILMQINQNEQMYADQQKKQEAEQIAMQEFIGPAGTNNSEPKAVKIGW